MYPFWQSFKFYKNEEERKGGDENSHLFDTTLIKAHSGSCSYRNSSYVCMYDIYTQFVNKDIKEENLASVMLYTIEV